MLMAFEYRIIHSANSSTFDTVTKIFLFVKCRPVTTIDILSTILDSSQSFNMTYNLLYHVGLDVRFL